MSARPIWNQAENKKRAQLRGRLLFFVNDGRFFLSHRLPVARAAKKAGMEVHVATPLDAAAEEIQREGFCFHEVPIDRWGANPWHELRSLFAIRRVLREAQPDVLHNITIKPILLGSLAARVERNIWIVNALPGLGTVFIQRGIGASVRRRIVEWLYRFLFRFENVRVICQNPDDLMTLCKAGIVGKMQGVLIKGSGVDLEAYRPSPLPIGKPLVVMASRMLWDKGARQFVNAAEELARRHISARFVLVGGSEQGNPSAIPREVLEEWDRRGTVEWWGHRVDMDAVFARATVVCLPTSYGEGVPKVLLEAAACGRPLIASNVPGCREIVKHGENGFLVAPKDANALADAIFEVVEAPQLARRMGQRSRQIVESEFGVNHVIYQTLKLYNSLLQ